MLKEKLLEDLKEYMKEKNTIRKNVVQMVRAAILQVEKDKHIEVSDDKIVEIIAKEAKKRKDSLEDFQKSGREDLIEQINKEIEILNEYLPKQLTQEELEQKIKEIESVSKEEIINRQKVIEELNKSMITRNNSRSRCNIYKRYRCCNENCKRKNRCNSRWKSNKRNS